MSSPLLDLRSLSGRRSQSYDGSSNEPPSLRNLNGNWIMSKTLSSDVSSVLAIQGHSALVRKAIAYAPIQLVVKQSTSEIRIQQYTTAGFPAINELWTCDWKDRLESNMFTGRLCTKSRWIRASDIDDEFLTQGTSSPDEEILEAHVESLDKKWVARQIWRVDETGRFTRRVQVRKGSQEAYVLLVYEKKGYHSNTSSPSIPSSQSSSAPSSAIRRKDSLADSETDDGYLSDGSLGSL